MPTVRPELSDSAAPGRGAGPRDHSQLMKPGSSSRSACFSSLLPTRFWVVVGVPDSDGNERYQFEH